MIDKTKKVKNEQKEKQIKRVRNFDPTRLKNVSYQVRMRRKLAKKWRKKRKFPKKTNKWS